MTIPVQCPSCGQYFKARDELAGKAVKCPTCGEALRVPAPRATAAAPAPARAPAAPARRQRWPWIAGAAAIGCLVPIVAVIAVVGWLQFGPGGAARRVTLDDTLVGEWIDAENSQESLRFEKEDAGRWGKRLRYRNAAFPSEQADLLYTTSVLHPDEVEIHFRDVYPEEGVGISDPELAVRIDKDLSRAWVVLLGRKHGEPLNVVLPRWVKGKARVLPLAKWEVAPTALNATAVVTSNELSLTFSKPNSSVFDVDGKTYKYRKAGK